MSLYDQILEAKREGWSDEEILAHVHHIETGLRSKIDEAKAEGYSDRQILRHVIELNSPHYTPSDPTEDMSGLSTFAAGQSRGVRAIGRGAKQLAVEGANLIPGVNLDDTAARLRAEEDEIARVEAPLMNTTGGWIGDMVGQGTTTAPIAAGAGALAARGGAMATRALPSLTKVAPAAATRATLAPYAQTALQGGVIGLANPVGTEDSRALNTAISTAAGPATVLGLKGLHALGNAGVRVLEPWLPGGPARIARRAVGDAAANPQAAIANLKADPGELIPGSAPTAAQASKDVGIGRLEKSLRQVSNEASQTFKDREAAQNAARVQALRGIAGDKASIKAAQDARDKAVAPLRQAVSKSDVRVNVAPTVNLIDRMLGSAAGQVDELAGPVQKIRAKLVAADNVPEQLYGVRRQAATIISQGIDGKPLDDQVARELTVIMKSIDNQIAKVDPSYKKYLNAYSEGSRPIDRLEVGQYVLNKGTGPLDSVGGEPAIKKHMLAEALRDSNTTQTVKRATGFKRNKGMESVMQPDDMKTYKALTDDLTRSESAQNLIKEVASDTAQNLSGQNILRGVTGPFGLPDRWADSTAIRGIAAVPQLLYRKVAEPRVQAALAEVLAEPKATLAALERAIQKKDTPRYRKILTRILAGGTSVGTTQED